jgi:hypothetical protein
VIRWLEYYNPNHDNPAGSASADDMTAGLLLGQDLTLTDCASVDLGLIGLNDAINCIAKEKGATPVDAYTPFQSACATMDCFSDALHPNDNGYGLIFDALRDTPADAVATTPPADGSWPYVPGAPENMTLPALVGTPAPRSMLNCSLGTWSGNAPLSYARQWLRDGLPIAGEAGATYVVQTADINDAISCRVTASNAVGSSAATSSALLVRSPPAPPRISSLRATRRRFGARRGRHPGGTVFTYQLSEPGRVLIAIQRLAPGRRVAHRCRAPSARLRGRPRCTRTFTLVEFHMAGRAGTDRFAFTGRAHGAPLKPGDYRATVTAMNSTGSSPAVTLEFWIVAA